MIRAGLIFAALAAPAWGEECDIVVHGIVLVDGPCDVKQGDGIVRYVHEPSGLVAVVLIGDNGWGTALDNANSGLNEPPNLFLDYVQGDGTCWTASDTRICATD